MVDSLVRMLIVEICNFVIKTFLHFPGPNAHLFLFFSLRVRGQHTKTTGRRGRTVGVSKKK